MAAHVDGQHVVAGVEMRGQVIESTRDAIEAVHHDERRLVGIAPIDVVDAQAIDVEDVIDWQCRGRLASVCL